MRFQSILLLLFILSCYIASCTVSGGETDALLSIKSHLVDPLNQLGDWNVTTIGNGLPHCNWTGVRCNANGEVETLDLSHMNLTGTVSDRIQALKSLTTLNLCGNGFSTPLPESLSNLTSLKFLDVSQNFFIDSFPIGFGRISGLIELNASSNSFTGEIPDDVGNLTVLESLDLRGSFFEGLFPNTLGNLKKLKFLGLAGNNLTGPLPPEIGQLTSLETMIIGYNGFEGEIPKEIGNLTNLQYLDLAVGNLDGPIPAEIGNLKKLNTILMYKNSFEDEIPPEIGSITYLQILDLSDNMLSGKIPDEMSGLKNLQLLNLLCNNLSGPVPYGLGDLTQLEVLELWNNSLSGSLPSNLGKNSPLQWLDMSSNNLSGPIPSTLCFKGNLTKLILFNNLLSGPIPVGLSTCNSIVRVRMQNNLLSGIIPIGFGKLGKLQRLELANNNLIGPIPIDLAGSTSLSFLDFSYNHLQSSLSSSILSIPNLQTFMASDNNLVGEIPDQFQDCPSLAVLDLSSNHFTGSIPTSIASCQKLVTLDLHSNQLTGEIPISLAMMHMLSILDLSNNSLTGGIPKTLGNSPALETLNVSYNKLEGVVPENGILRTISPDDLKGNAGLCGGVLSPCSHSLSYASKQKGLQIKHVIAGWIIGISILIGIVIFVFGVRSLHKRWYLNGSCFEKRLAAGKGEWPWRLMAFQRLNFTSNEVLACIKESNVIGMGATGTVYKADVARSNTIVAVKKLWRTQTDIEHGGSDDLVGEVNLLGKLRHRNIVRLLGFLHNDRDTMIIYEYMRNGSLGEVLHAKEGTRLLVDWVSRYNIAVGVAQGLAYLHHDCHPPIIHRDVKSNNILLDGNLEARVADFGLAKMMIKKDETVSMVAGSYGYIAPEYGYTLKVDEKSDIYSYGVVLLELLTGKRPLEPEFGESVDINEWIRKKIRDNRSLEAALDPNVGNCKYVQEEMLLVLRIALICTAKQPKDRPSMRDVITMLGEAKPRRKSSSASTVNAADKDTPIFTTSPVNGLL